MTLSHCWGIFHGRMRLTREVLEAWKGTLPKEQLEQMETFHVAIQVGQACSIKYLWIDCLVSPCDNLNFCHIARFMLHLVYSVDQPWCIIQDDREYVAQELSVMDSFMCIPPALYQLPTPKMTALDAFSRVGGLA